MVRGDGAGGGREERLSSLRISESSLFAVPAETPQLLEDSDEVFLRDLTPPPPPPPLPPPPPPPLSETPTLEAEDLPLPLPPPSPPPNHATNTEAGRTTAERLVIKQANQYEAGSEDE